MATDKPWCQGEAISNTRMAAWYPELAAAVMPLTTLPGFGPYMVCGVAASLFAKKTDGEEWTPSEEWARYFMCKHMKLVVRRVTSHMIHPAAVEKQLQLHDINLNIVSLALADEGLQPSDIYFMDEFGAFFAPVTQMCVVCSPR